METNLIKLEVYKSERFTLKGNTGWRIDIVDLHESKLYVIEYSELAKFRRHWEKVNKDKKDIFLIAFISSRTGKAIEKAA